MNRRNLIRRAKEILGPLDRYHRNCHVASLHLVREGLGDRVARGACRGVGNQHSWVVIGDPYAPAIIIDPTLWSYRSDVSGVFVGSPDIYGQRLSAFLVPGAFVRTKAYTRGPGVNATKSVTMPTWKRLKIFFPE